VDHDKVGTLHSICYHALGRPEIAELKTEEFNKEYPHFALTGDGTKGVEDPHGKDVINQTFKGDDLMRKVQNFRARMIDRKLWTSDARVFWNAWSAWKKECGYLDFTDLIEHGIEDLDSAPGSPAVGIFDECLDGDSKIAFEDDQQISIRDIVEKKISGNVWSMNLKTKQLELKKITGWHKVPLNSRAMCKIGSLKLTSDHPVYTKEHGYISFDQSKVLGCNQDLSVLQLAYENLRPKRKTHEHRTINHSRVASWRRRNFVECREEWKCTGKIRSGICTTQIPKMEIRTSEAMGFNSADRTCCNGIWGICLSIFNKITSCFHDNLSLAISNAKEKWETNYSRVVGIPRRFGSGCLVYGRWFERKIFCDPFNICVATIRLKISGCQFESTGYGLQNLYGNERTNNSFFFKGGAKSFQDHQAIHAPAFQLQTKSDKKTENEKGKFGGVIAPNERVRDLWNRVCSVQIKNSLQRILSKKNDAPISKGFSRTHHSSRRSDNGGVRNLWEEIFEKTKKMFRQFSKAANMFSPMHCKVIVGNSEESFVYCIDVEDNNNFFAENILVHNCQDFSRQQMTLVRKWSEKMEYILIGGDDDQCIFSFAGATPDAFLDPPIPDKQKQILTQSYRVPRAVHRVAEKWIRQIKNREQKDYLPRDFEGEAKLIQGSANDPHLFIKEVERWVTEEDESVMILASCSYMLSKTIALLRERGLPFHNPYRKINGAWNPLQKRRGAKMTADRLTAFANPTLGFPPVWSMSDIDLFIGHMRSKGAIVRGAKNLPKEYMERDVEMPDTICNVYREMLRTIFEPDIADEMMLQLEQGPDAGWYIERVLPTKRKPYKYPMAVLKNHGMDGIVERPKITVGTGHSVKGGQADNVIIMPDLSVAGDREWGRPGVGRDSIVRLMYVMMTRARNKVRILKPAGSLSVDLRLVNGMLR